MCECESEMDIGSHARANRTVRDQKIEHVRCEDGDSVEEDEIDSAMQKTWRGLVDICFDTMASVMSENRTEQAGNTMKHTLCKIPYLSDVHLMQLWNSYPILDFLEWATSIMEPPVMILWCHLCHKFAKRKFPDMMEFLCHESHSSYIYDCFKAAGDNIDNNKIVIKLVTDMCCGGKMDQSVYHELIFERANEVLCRYVASYIYMQIKYLPLNDNLFNVMNAIWDSGNVIARRYLLRGIRRLVKLGAHDKVGAFINDAWMDRLAKAQESPMAVDSTYVYSVLGDLCEYVDVMPCVNPMLMVRWLSQNDALAAEVQCAIAIFWRRLIDAKPEYIEHLLSPLEDASVLDRLLDGLGDRSYKAVEAIIDLLVMLFRKGSPQHVTSLSAAVLTEHLLEMIHTVKPVKIGSIVQCILMSFEAFAMTGQGDSVKEAFEMFNGHEILTSLEDLSEDTSALITRVMEIMSE